MTNGFSTFLNLYANNGLSLSYRIVLLFVGGDQRVHCII